MPRSKNPNSYPSQFITLVDLFDQTIEPIEIPFPTHTLAKSFKSKWYFFIGALEHASKEALKRKDHEEASRYRLLANKARCRQLSLELSKIVFTLRDVSHDATAVEKAIQAVLDSQKKSLSESTPKPLDYSGLLEPLRNPPPVEGMINFPPNPEEAPSKVGPVNPSEILKDD